MVILPFLWVGWEWTKSGDIFRPGISLCYEQWTPSVWTNTAKRGADFFVHMAAEGWYGNYGFAQFMANVTRFRAIENRRSVIRSSNVGLSMFIDAKGKTYAAIPSGSLDLSTADVQTNTQITWYAKYPDMFPIGCLGVVLISIFISFFNYKKPIL